MELDILSIEYSEAVEVRALLMHLSYLLPHISVIPSNEHTSCLPAPPASM